MSRRWTDQERQYLVENWLARRGREHRAEVARHLGRTLIACEAYAFSLGLVSHLWVLPDEDTKVCPKCGRDMPLSEYYRKSSAFSGRCSQCKDCMRAYAVRYARKRRARRQRQAA